MNDHPYIIKLSNGDWAEADTLEGAMLAAKTLRSEADEARGTQGPPPTATIVWVGRGGLC